MDGSVAGPLATAGESGPARDSLALAVIEQISPGVLAFDARLRLLLANARARELLGFGEGAEGGALSDLLPEAALSECRRALSRTGGEVAARITRPGFPALRWRTRRLEECWLATLDEARHGGVERDDFALLDPLTGLGSRHGFTEAVAGAFVAGTALVMLDLDRFKLVNDTLGHPVGDAVLRLVGQRIAGAVRAEDSAFRLGGDEFAILLRDGAGAHALAERLVELIARPYLTGGVVATVGASAGIAYCPGDGTDPDTLVRCADMALYAAKADGRGVVRPFRPEMAQRAAARHALEQDLRAAVARGQLELFYQPQANLESRELVGFEALLRWRHPERGLVSPGEFIPLAEETRLILSIGDWALRTACRDAQGWPAPLPVAVNVSAVQLAEPARLCRTVEHALAASGLDAARLELEITESALVHDPAGALEALRALRAMGVRIAMDDFGTGYSSLSQLRSFPFDKLKIDRSFIADLGGSDEAVAVVRAIAALGTSLGMRTTAEGVETGEQADQVLAEGCTDMQGYLLSRPLPAGDIAGLIRDLKKQL
jgi:diguanylate cyclase (GGDEF)-like protein